MSNPTATSDKRGPITIPNPETLVSIPRSSIWSVKEVFDEYALRELPPMDEPFILDVGANVGIFALAAMERWPGATIHCFEPHPDTCGILLGNLRQEIGTGKVGVVHVAVDHPVQEGAKGLLNEGVNRLCCSLIDRSAEGETIDGKAVEVDVIDSAILGPCDVLKLDTEGREVAILQGYPHLDKVQVLLVEIHRLEDREPIVKMAEAAGLSPIDQRTSTLRFRRKTSGDRDKPHFFDVSVGVKTPEGGKT
jgi:FkbM family methyltransferase